MTKEKLTLDAIKLDLTKIADHQISCKSEWRFTYIIPITLLAILLGVLLQNLFVGVIISSVAVYHIVRYIIDYKKYKAKKMAILSVIERGEISISIEIFSYIVNKAVYEPHQVGKRSRMTKTVTVYHFGGGTSWRAPLYERYYEWSKDFYISPKGLENISIAGDEFFFVALQEYHDIAYIYPCKNFELDGSLKK